MIDKLSSSTDPTVFAVTPDLASMLGKKNFVKIGTMPQPFGNEIVEKTLMVNPATSAEDLFGTSFLEDSGETMRSFLDGLKNSGLSLYSKNGKHYFTDQNNPLYKEPPIILHKNGGHLKRK